MKDAGTLTIDPVDFDSLPTDRLQAMLAAGETVQDCQRVLEKTEDNIVGELLKSAGTFFEWQHYPDGDVYDHETHAQYYYHAHPKDERPGEHGHFHTFLRPKGMPKNVKPSRAVPDYKRPEANNDALSHLIAISMDRRGYAIKLFTTNRWVTGEYWYRASDVVKLLDYFLIDIAQPSWPVNKWVSAMIGLYRPQIEALIQSRDESIDLWAKGKKPDNVYEDRDLEVTSEIDIDVADQMSDIRAALARRKSRGAA